MSLPPVYSTLFADGNVTSAGTSYATPAGKLAVVRTIIVGNPGTTGITINFGLTGVLMTWSFTGTTGLQYATEDLHLTVPYGRSFTVWGTAGKFAVSGYLLSAP